MFKSKTLLLFMFLLWVINTNAQQPNPFQSIGKKAKVLTAYGGRFDEFFDYDSIQSIGSVLFNINSKKIVRFLDADKTFDIYSDNSSVSRWFSVDPLADKFHSWSPYNFVLNNPIKLVDPDGRAPWDDYYSKTGKFLGSDGAATTNQRIISAETFYSIEDQNKGTTSQSATTDLQANSKVLTVAIAGGKTEGEYFQGLYAAGNGDGKNPSTYKEMSATLLLNPNDASLTVYTNSSIGNQTSGADVGNPNNIPGVKNGSLIVLGDAHTHQIADLADPRNRNIATQTIDMGAAKSTGKPVFTIDSQNVDVAVPGRGMAGPYSTPRDNIAPTQNLYNNSFSILRTALQIFGGK
jgi:hypothetical protein